MWQKVLSSEALPTGTAKAVTVGEGAIGLFRTVEGLFAIDNRCTHYDAELHLGEVTDGIVYCPWHRWPFRLRDGRCTLNHRFDTTVYRVKEQDGYIWVDPGSGTHLRGADLE